SRPISPSTARRSSKPSAATAAAAIEESHERRSRDPVRGEDHRPGAGPGGGDPLRGAAGAPRRLRCAGRGDRVPPGGDRGRERGRDAAAGPGLRPVRPGREVSVEAAQLRKIEEGAAQMGVRLGPEQIKQLGRHVDLMLKWNKSVNLTAITDPDEVAEKHVLDSLAVVPVLPSGSLLDAGSGAGFPGIPVAIARPDLGGSLVDSV